MVWRKRSPYPVPKLVSLEREWKVLRGDGKLVAIGARYISGKACPGIRHCAYLYVTDKVYLRLYNYEAGGYTVFSPQQQSSITAELETDFVGRYLPKIGLLVLTDDKGKILTPEEVQEILSKYDPGDVIEELRVEAKGLVALNSDKKVSSVYNILNNEGFIHYEPITKSVGVHSRSLGADLRVRGDATTIEVHEATTLDSNIFAVIIPRLRVVQREDDRITAIAKLGIKYTYECPYRGNECWYAEECYKYKLVAHKDGSIELTQKQIDCDELRAAEILEKAS